MPGSVRLVDVLGGLSLACDAADGFPHDTTIRTAVLAARLARAVDAADALVADVVVGALLRHIGCTGFAVEEAHRYGGGDDVRLRHVMAEVDFGQPDRAASLIAGGLAPQGAQTLFADGPVAGARHAAAQCDAAERLIALLPVGGAAAAVASDAFERWDGRGGPYGRAGEAISLVARIVEVAYVAELFRGRQGRGGALAELRLRAGGQLDPMLVEQFVASAGPWFDELDDPAGSAWDLLLAAEPDPPAMVSAAQLEDVALAFARFSDLKSVWFTGHSEAVALVADAAAAEIGLERAVRHDLRLAGLLHDIGRVGVPTGIWDVPRPLSVHERDRVRFHVWETHRILGSIRLLSDLAEIAGQSHERRDGSGYHRGVMVTDPAAALLATADVWCALVAARPHRTARTPAQARDELAAAVATGALDPVAVDAVLAATHGERLAPVRATRPSGLTDREVEVLQRLATGASDKGIAADLGITTKTVAHHVQHVYDKIGVRSRAGATLFAVEHGLVPARGSQR